MAQEEKALRTLRDLDDAEVPVRRRAAKDRIALCVVTAAVALGLLSFTGSWLGLLPLVALPYMVAKMSRAQAELRGLQRDGEF